MLDSVAHGMINTLVANLRHIGSALSQSEAHTVNIGDPEGPPRLVSSLSLTSLPEGGGGRESNELFYAMAQLTIASLRFPTSLQAKVSLGIPKCSYRPMSRSTSNPSKTDESPSWTLS